MSQLYEWDQELFRLIHVELQRDWLDPILVAITDSGRGEVKFTILLVFCFIYRFRNYALMALTAGVLSGICAQLLKLIVTRDRPGNFEFAQPITSYIEALMGQTAPMASNSFPSGHATSSFAIAVAIAWVSRKTEHAWLGWTVVGWASLVAFSRVYVGVHFMTDVLAGAALGALFGTLFYLLWRKQGWIPGLSPDP